MSGNGPYDDRFAPDAWSALLDAPPDEPAGFLFRRGLELAGETVARQAHPGELWLDVGCGPGHLTAGLAARGLRAIGVDHDPAMLRVARQRRQGAGSPSPALVLAAAQRLPLADATVRGIVAVSLMGCLADPLPFLHEARRVLERDGWLIVTVTHRSSLLRRLEHVVALAWPRARAVGGDVVHAYAAAEIRGAITRAEFTIVGEHGYGLHLQLGAGTVPGIASSRALERRGDGRVARALARNLLLVARRR